MIWPFKPNDLDPDAKLRAIIAHVMLMGHGTYDTPDDWASGLLRRLDYEGYRIVPKDTPKETPNATSIRT